MKRSIYRESRLRDLSSPEQLDQLVRVTTPKDWIALFTLSSLLFAGLLWGILGRLPVVVTAQGALVNPGGVVRVVALEDGQLLDMSVDVGDMVQRDQAVATVKSVSEGITTTIVSPYTGQVLAVMISKGDFVQQGAPILTLGPLSEDLELVLYVPLVEASDVKPGMPVHIAPQTVEKEAYGFLMGEVSSVAEFPATAEGMRHILGTDELVQIFLGDGAPIQIRVSLIPDLDTPSGYAWSSSSGPGFRLSSGTLCSARIVVREQRPIIFLLPLGEGDVRTQ